MSNNQQDRTAPGPWRYDNDTEHVIASGERGHIATAEPASGPLIALAPEMADAILTWSDANGWRSNNDHSGLLDIAHRLRQIGAQP